jgi:hypothetical protein
MTKSSFTKLILLLTAALATLPITLAQSPTTVPIAPTSSLGEPTRTAKLESDDPEMRYQNGFFFTADQHGRVHIFDKDGHLKADLTLRPQEENPVSSAMDNVALFEDGSIVAGWFYLPPGERRDYISLIHYDPAGNFIEQIDLGEWRAEKVCIADDKKRSGRSPARTKGLAM